MTKPLLLLFSLFVMISSSAVSQDLKELLIDGQAIRIANEKVTRRDQNGNQCAAIQITSDMDGFIYDSNDGIVGKVEKKPGINIVYLTSSERVLKIFKNGYTHIQLILYEYGINLKPGEMWQITIEGEEVIESLPVTIKHKPTDAIIIIDNNQVYGSTHMLTFGQHILSIEKQGYMTLKDTIYIDSNNVVFERELEKKIVAPSSENTTLKSNQINNDPTAIEMILVKGGKFSMGKTNQDKKEVNEELLAHEVTVFNFHIGKYEITQYQWREIMGSTSHFAGCNDCPVTDVSWEEVQEFIEVLNEKTGKFYRLPTEAEWEYAARGGYKLKSTTDTIPDFKYSGSNEIDDVAWYLSNAGNKIQPVGQKESNSLGIYDMSGNAWEWCNDWYDKNYYAQSQKINPTGPSSGALRILRGGSLKNYQWSCQVHYRYRNAPDYFDTNIGFRLALFPN